jgi:hypothetical protein
MSKLDLSVLDVTRGRHRMNVVWLEPAAAREHDEQYTNDQYMKEQYTNEQYTSEQYMKEQYTHAPQGPHGVLGSSGEWVKRAPNTFARHRVAIPVTVGSTLR